MSVIEHSGGINGLSTHATRIPEAGIFIAVLSNVGGGADPHALANRIASAVLARELFPA